MKQKQTCEQRKSNNSIRPPSRSTPLSPPPLCPSLFHSHSPSASHLSLRVSSVCSPLSSALIIMSHSPSSRSSAPSFLYHSSSPSTSISPLPLLQKKYNPPYSSPRRSSLSPSSPPSFHPSPSRRSPLIPRPSPSRLSSVLLYPSSTTLFFFCLFFFFFLFLFLLVLRGTRVLIRQVQQRPPVCSQRNGCVFLSGESPQPCMCPFAGRYLGL
jgi:hypothetical protein